VVGDNDCRKLVAKEAVRRLEERNRCWTLRPWRTEDAIEEAPVEVRALRDKFRDVMGQEEEARAAARC
jgi:hypothetical protein